MAFNLLTRSLPLRSTRLLSSPASLRAFSSSPIASTSAAPQAEPQQAAEGPLKLEPEVSPKLLSYFIPRSAAGGLPVYSELKNGGQRVLTVVRKVDGNLDALRKDLEQFLGPEASAYTKPQARQVVLRGDWTREVKEILSTNGF